VIVVAPHVTSVSSKGGQLSPSRPRAWRITALRVFHESFPDRRCARSEIRVTVEVSAVRSRHPRFGKWDT